jgi:hypothetical protein
MRLQSKNIEIRQYRVMQRSHYSTMIENAVTGYTPAALKANVDAVSGLKTQVAKMSKTLDGVAKPSAELKKLQADLIQLANDQARKAVEQPKVVALGVK